MIRIVVYGLPAPQGSKRYVGTSKAGRGILVESSKAVKPWREAVKSAALEQVAGQSPLDGPLAVRMVFTLPKPASAPKKRRTWPCRKPDASKLARSTEDAMTDAGVWIDDARIVRLEAIKAYPLEAGGSLDRPGAVITIAQVVERP